MCVVQDASIQVETAITNRRAVLYAAINITDRFIARRSEQVVRFQSKVSIVFGNWHNEEMLTLMNCMACIVGRSTGDEKDKTVLESRPT